MGGSTAPPPSPEPFDGGSGCRRVPAPFTAEPAEDGEGGDTEPPPADEPGQDAEIRPAALAGYLSRQ